MRPQLTSVLALALAGLPVAAAAEDGPGEEVVVTGSRDADIRSATKTDTPLARVPQAVSVVGEGQIEAASLHSIADVIRYVPGASFGQGEGHRDQVTLRGNGSTSDFFLDGIRDDVQYYRGLYNLERVEVLKGPNALIFGRGGGGGVVNRVLKVPGLAGAFSRGETEVDSFGAYEVETDLNQPLLGGFGLRLNAVHERFDNHRDFYRGNRDAVNPTARLQADERTTIDLAFEYAEDDRVIDRGVPSIDGRPLRGYRDTFFGLPGFNDSQFDARVGRAGVERRLGEESRITTRLMWGDYDKRYANVFANGAVTTDAAGAQQVALGAYQDETYRRNLFSQTDLVLPFDTGALEHKLLFGVEVGDQDTLTRRLNGCFGAGTACNGRAVVALADRIAVPAVLLTPNREVRTEVDLLSFYAQDQLRISDTLELVAGLRWDRFNLALADQRTGAAFSRTDNLLSPRLGAVWSPAPFANLYASWSRSFLPQSGDQFASLDLTSSALEPEKFENLEVGAKFNLRPGLLLSLAAYQLDRTNTRAADPADPSRVVLTGAQRSRGVELDLSGYVRPGWFVKGGYALQDAEVTRTTAAAPAGREVALVPTHQASLWTSYDVTAKLGLGLGVSYQSKVFTSIGNTVALPGFARVDAMLRYAVAPQVTVQANVENLFNATYFPTAHNDFNISTGAPRNARLTLRVGL